MRRVFTGALVIGALAFGGTVWATPLSTAPIADDTEAQIRDAYADVLNEYVPMRERLAAIEGGKQLRATLQEFDALDTVAGIEFRAVTLSVSSVRAHDGDAEVQLAIYVDYYMVTGWSGVARKIDGRWFVARDTLCTLFLEWTPVRCPDGPRQVDYSQRKPARARTVDGETVIPITFTDGDRADLVVPTDLRGDWRIVPHAELVLEERTAVTIYFQDGRVAAQQPVRTYPGAPGHADVTLDAMFGLLVHLDGWTVYVTAEHLSEHERRLIAKHLDGYTTKGGFPVLIPSGPLQFRQNDPLATTGVVLVKSALNVDTAANPMELWYADGDEVFVTVVITPGPCPDVLQRPYISGTYRAEERCTVNGFGRIAVEGNADFVTRLLDEVRVENYRAAPALTTV